MWHQMEQETSLMDMWFISGWNINTHLKSKENNKNKENQNNTNQTTIKTEAPTAQINQE